MVSLLAHSAIWQNGSESRRVLWCTDALASVTTLVVIVTSMARLEASERSSLTLNMGLHPNFTTAAVFAAYFVIASLPLALLLARPGAYTRFRLHLCLANRLMRLWVLTCFCFFSQELDNIAEVVVSRSLGHAHKPRKALLIMLLHPVCFFMQQALFVLPFRIVLVLQLISTVNTLNYSRLYFCGLQPVAAAPSMAPTVAEAERVCSTAQALASLVTSAAAWDAGLVGAHNQQRQQQQQQQRAYDACAGINAVHVLHIFGVLCGIGLLPVLATYELDRVLTRRQQQRLEAAAAENARAQAAAAAAGSSRGRRQGAASSAAGSGGMASASSSGGSGGSGSGGFSPGAGSSFTNSASSSSGTRGNRGNSATGGSQTGGHPLLGGRQQQEALAAPRTDWHLVLLCMCVPVALALAWQLSEALGEVFSATIDCTVLPAAVATAATAA